MAKTPKNPDLPNSSLRRPARSSAPVSFANENDSDAIQSDSDVNAYDVEAKEDEGNESENGLDLDKFMREIQKRQARKTSMLSTAFENQKKALYTSARKQAKDMSREGIAYLEDLKSTLLEPKKDEIPLQRYLDEMAPLWKHQEASLASLYELYPSAIDDLFVRRARVVDEASGMLRTNPSKREKALNQFLRSAHKEVERNRQNEINATDASKLIKHYKALLLS